MNFSRLVLSVLLAAVASAQDRYVWSGVRIRDGKREGKAVSAMSEAEIRDAKRADPAAALMKELAEIRLLANVDRKTEEASKRIEDLRIRAAWELEYPGRLDVLVEVAKTRSELFAKLGRGEEAANAVTRLLPDEDAKRAAPTYELVPASAKILEEEQRGLKDPRLAPLGGQTPSPPPSPRDEIESAVFQAYANYQYQVARDIGPRAAPALEKLVLAMPGELVAVEKDPLTALFEVAPAAGVKFAVENYERGGFFWHKRILRSLLEKDPQRLANPVWAPIVARLLDDPEMRRDALPILSQIGLADAMGPEIQASLLRTLDSTDSDFPLELVKALSTYGAGKHGRPVVEKMLQSPIAEVRHWAAGRTQPYASSDAMLRCVDHEDPEMRRQLALFLTDDAYTHRRTVHPKLDAPEREVLGKLAADSDASVRAQAAEAIAFLETPLGSEVYSALARDRDPKVLEAFDPALLNLAQKPGLSWYLGVLRERRANAALPMGAKWDKTNVVQLFQPLLQTKDGTRAAVGWALEGDDELFRSIASGLCVDPPNPDASSTRFEAWKSGESGGLQALDDKAVELVYRRAFVASRDDVFMRLHVMLCHHYWSGKPRSGAMLPILQDPAASRELRTYAARVFSTSASVDVEALVSFFIGPSWTKGPPTSAEERSLYEIGTLLRQTMRPELARRVVESKDATDAVVLALVSEVASFPGLPRPVLDRWLADFLSGAAVPERADVRQRVMLQAIGALPEEHDDTVSKYLLRALDDARVRDAAIVKMGTLRWPEFLDPLGERARNGTETAVAAVGGYMNDRAVEYLLDAVGRSPYDEFRKSCLAQLDSIRRYQDEKARWATRKGGQQARDDAIAQLLPMLSDGDEKIRAQAVLSLATLEAVEHLPRIVQLLKDKSPAVRQAAQQALDKLNASRETKKP